MAYITETLLNDIDKEVVTILKTAYNTMDIMVSSGTSAIYISAIPPDTEPTEILLPIFVNSATTQYGYSQIDAIKIDGDPVLSAYPGPNTMTISNENGTGYTVSNISTNECMIYAITNGIIKRLINDNKLVFNDNNSAFRWKTVLSTSLPITFTSGSLSQIYTFAIDSSIISVSNLNSVNIMYKLSTGNVWYSAYNYSINELDKSISITVNNLDIINVNQNIDLKVFYCYT